VLLPLTRGPAFHVYADQRTWLGIPHAGDVLSNLAFVVVALWALQRARSPFARLCCAGVALIGIGSATYHVAPSDTTLALDWTPIALGLAFITAAVIDDRFGARAGRTALVVGCLLAIGAVASWLATGGTGGTLHGGLADDVRSHLADDMPGGTMLPYVCVQALGVALPPLIALARPGRIPARPLLVAVLLFAIARLCAAQDRVVLAMLGVSGHSLKHIAAALAAGCALYAITTPATNRPASATSPASRASLSSS
jgi:hypothetical protein